ncbi:hypothetical protein [Bifidobacterium bombi]|uniref:Uncharacterized protein n=1 Tax=Bifidobacterium bombi DSM 19703 TaxID=1341695 RepID=A0A080N4E2_9BIFI|nr:hypothetical protein [Bifidobacterium bombi]KFF31265.1 hypothetical protein BBOMB_0605 [Bifidobacterium bombi DSM 19703]
MTIGFEKLTALAETSLALVAGVNDIKEGLGRDALDAGEPDIAIADALDAAMLKPELFAQFPPEVKELAKDPDYYEIEVYADQLNV